MGSLSVIGEGGPVRCREAFFTPFHRAHPNQRVLHSLDDCLRRKGELRGVKAQELVLYRGQKVRGVGALMRARVLGEEVHHSASVMGLLEMRIQKRST